MKNYKVNVNGTEYAISIELISEEEAKKIKKFFIFCIFLSMKISFNFFQLKNFNIIRKNTI